MSHTGVEVFDFLLYSIYPVIGIFVIEAISRLIKAPKWIKLSPRVEAQPESGLPRGGVGFDGTPTPTPRLIAKQSDFPAAIDHGDRARRDGDLQRPVLHRG